MTKVVSVQLGHFIFFTFDSKLLLARPVASERHVGVPRKPGQQPRPFEVPNNNAVVRRQSLYLGMITLSMT